MGDENSSYGSRNTPKKVVFGGRRESGCGRETLTVRDGGALVVEVDTLPSRGEGSGSARRRGYVRNRARAEKAASFGRKSGHAFVFYFDRCRMLLPGARLDSGRSCRTIIHISKISTRRGVPQHARTARYPPSKFAVFAFRSVCFPIFGEGD